MIKKIVFILGFTTILFNSAIYAQLGTGLSFTFQHKSNLRKSNPSSLGFAGIPPSSYSLKAYTPYPKNQGNYSTCVSWAMSYSALSTQYAINMNITNRNIITSTAFCPYFVHNNSKEVTDGCAKGSFFEDAAIELTDIGAKKFYLPMIGCATPNDAKMLIVARNYRAKDVTNIYNYEDNVSDDYPGYMKLFMKKTPFNSDDVKKTLVANKVVIIGIYLPSSFKSTYGKDLWEPNTEEKNDPYGGLLNSKDELHALHAVTIIGYDDAKYGGAFEIQNSWGTLWGDQGYIWVKYEDLQKYVFQVLVIDMPALVMNGTTGCINGDCNNGYGIYKHENGEMYEGFFKNGKYNGYGIYAWTSGSTYAGEWKDGLRNGDGVIYYTDGTYGSAVYESDQFRSGFQKYDYNNGSTYDGYVKDGEFNGFGTYTFTSGDSYQGTFIKNNYNGLGKYKFSDGSFYIGHFEDGKRNGHGLFVSNDGKIWGGKWSYDQFIQEKKQGFSNVKKLFPGKVEIGANTNYVDANCTSGDCLNGKGTRNYVGKVYEGEFKDGVENGLGKTTYTNGMIVESFYLGGKATCFCIITYKNGTSLIGSLKNGDIDGYVVYFDESGSASIGTYEEGTYMGEVTTTNSGKFSSVQMSYPENAQFNSIPTTNTK